MSSHLFDENYQLIWQDEFEGLLGNNPDASRWNFEIGGHGWGNQEKQYYTNLPSNAALDGNSCLVINVLPVEQSHASNMDCWYGPCGYTSARLITRGQFEFMYGCIEARIKIPHGQGIWPAFWMLGANYSEVHWPRCGEIDVMESIGSEPRLVYGTAHGPGFFGKQGIGSPFYLYNGSSFADNFHVYAVEWEPHSIKWYVDSHPFFTMTPADLPTEGQWVFDHPFYLILNVAVGGVWSGEPDATTSFPQHMLIDYVRIYQSTEIASMSNTTQLKEPSDLPKQKRIVASPNHSMRANILKELVSENGIGAEIGVHKGEFTRAILETIKPAKLHLVDLWYLFGKEWGWANGNRSTIDALVGILKDFDDELASGTLILHIENDLKALSAMSDHYFDWVYVDTSHQYEHTLKELELLVHKVKHDGVIAGDDWHIDPQHLHHGVYKAVHEFLAKHPYELIYADDGNKQWAIRRIAR